jgi:predicted phage-related endonuclease
MGVSPFKSELALYVEKIHEGDPDEDSSEIAEWGRVFEPIILKEYSRRAARRVVKGGQLLRSKHAPHHLVTLDGVQLTRPPEWARGAGVAEVKTTGYGARYDEDLPVEVQVQIQWELFVSRAAWATCIWLPFPERRLRWIDVAPHPAFQAVLAERVDRFWDRVQKRLPPDPDGSESSEMALRHLYPEDNDEVIRILDATRIADEYERNKAAIALLTTRNQLIKNTLAATIRSAKYALLDDGRYWGTAYYQPRENRCRHCNEVLSRTDSYRTYTLRAPRKKPFHVIGESRRLVVELEHGHEHELGACGDLTQQLTESIVGAGQPANDDRGAAE